MYSRHACFLKEKALVAVLLNHTLLALLFLLRPGELAAHTRPAGAAYA